MKATMLLGWMILSPALVQAGEIYGGIIEDGKPMGEGIEVKVVCPPAGGEISKIKTDAQGNYRLYVKTLGKCGVTVGSSEPATLSSYEEPVRYDLILEKGVLRKK